MIYRLLEIALARASFGVQPCAFERFRSHEPQLPKQKLATTGD
jgi:hypothetical protein